MNKSIIDKCSTCIFKYTEFGKDYEPLSPNAVLAEVRVSFNNLLNEAMWAKPRSLYSVLSAVGAYHRKD